MQCSGYDVVYCAMWKNGIIKAVYNFSVTLTCFIAL